MSKKTEPFKLFVNVGDTWLKTRGIHRREDAEAMRKKVEKASRGLILVTNEADQPLLCWTWTNGKWTDQLIAGLPIVGWQ